MTLRGLFARLWQVVAVVTTVHGAWSLAAAILGSAIVTNIISAATSLGGVYLVLTGAGLFFLILATVLTLFRHFSAQKLPRPSTVELQGRWVKPEDLAAYLDQINRTMEEHGFGRNPNLPQSKPRLSDTINNLAAARARGLAITAERAVPKLKAWQREQLRSLIQDGESLAGRDSLGFLELLAWERTVGEWIEKNLDQGRAQRFQFPVRDAESPHDKLRLRLEHLRALLLEHIPPGITHEHTPMEAIERYFDVVNVPYEERRQILEQAREVFREDGDPKRGGLSQPN